MMKCHHSCAKSDKQSMSIYALTNAVDQTMHFFSLHLFRENEIIKDATRTNKGEISNFSTRIVQFEFDSIRLICFSA